MKRGNEAVDGDQREEHNVRRRSDIAHETVEEANKEKWKGIEWTEITEEMRMNNKEKNGI